MPKFKTILNQQDPKWSNVLLGFNTSYPYTIGNYGCLITSQSMVCEYYGYPITPDKLNIKLKDINGFVSGGLYVWGSLPKVYPIKEKKIDTPAPLTDAQMTEIKKAIDSGYPVMFCIDYSPSTSALDTHYVVALEYQTNDFTVADPIDGTVKQLSKYSSKVRELIYQYVIYTGEVPETVDVSDLTDCEKKLAEMTALKDEWKQRAREAEKSFKSEEEALVKCKDICATLEQSRNNLAIQLSACENEKKELQKEVSDVRLDLENALKLIIELRAKISLIQQQQKEGKSTLCNLCCSICEKVQTFVEGIKYELKKYI